MFKIGLILSIIIGILCMFAVLNFAKSGFSKMADVVSHSIVYVTVPNEDVAKKLARALVEEKHAACVNIIPGINSIYSWKGVIEEEKELLLMIKTLTEKVNGLSDFVRKNHPYEVPEVISVKIENGNSAYLDWITKSVDKNTNIG